MAHNAQLEKICAAIKGEISQCKNVLVLNANKDFRGNGWRLTAETPSTDIEAFSPIPASTEFRYDCVICHDMALTKIMIVLNNSARRGVRVAVIIGECDCMRLASWSVSSLGFENAFILRKKPKVNRASQALEMWRKF